MLNRQLVWTGAVNDGVTPPSMARRVRLYDTTLRDGEQTVGVALNWRAKLAIAQALDRLGVDRIEAGFPRVSADDATAIEKILEAGLRAEVWGFARAVSADVQVMLDLGLRAAVVEAPVSDGKLRALGVDREAMCRRIFAAVETAASAGMRVCFFGVDGTRADPDFLDSVYAGAVRSGAAEIALVDTLGIASPEAISGLVRHMRDVVGEDVPLHWHGHDDFGLATAGSLAAVAAGADWVQGTVNGMGERAGNTDLPTFALALEALYQGETGMDFSLVTEVAETVRSLSGYALAPWKPVSGRNLFVRESGAVAAQFHEPAAVEPYSSTVVGARRGIVLGKKSGLASIQIKLTELGLELDQDLQAEALERVKETGMAKPGLVTDDEFRQIVRDVGATGGRQR